MATLDLETLNPCKAEWEIVKAACRAPVYSGSWNSWMLIYSTKDVKEITATKIAEDVKAAFGRDVAGRLFGGTFGADISNLEVVPFLSETVDADGSFADFQAAFKAQRMVAEKYQGTSSPTLSADLQRLTVPCNLRAPGPYWTLVMVNFIYRGEQKDVPWMSLKRFELFIPFPLGTNAVEAVAYMCPNKPTILLSEVMAPQTRAPEEPDSLGDLLKNHIERVKDELADVAKKGGESLLEGAAPILAIALVGWLILKP